MECMFYNIKLPSKQDIRGIDPQNASTEELAHNPIFLNVNLTLCRCL
jgi:hypothetical protein